jgi:hypothetical protein
MAQNTTTYKSFTTEYMEKYVNEFLEKNESRESVLLGLYIDRIRNGRELDSKMILEIEQFSNENKMKIIKEFNRCMIICYELIR